jgi:hypothetical protein
MGMGVCKTRTTINEMPNERIEPTPNQPDVPPPRVQMTDWSFTLQAVMELQKAVGSLTSIVSGLQRDSEKHGEQLDKISHQVSNARTAFILVGIALSAALSFVGYVGSKVVDLAIKHWGG